MTNREFYKEQILSIACSGYSLGFDKEKNIPCDCESISCDRCLFDAGINGCRKKCAEWCDSEYTEPCPFEKDELVEVSNDGKDWSLRYFSHFYKNGNNRGEFITYVSGKTSKETTTTASWEYCRKYGTLGGLVKGAEE